MIIYNSPSFTIFYKLDDDLIGSKHVAFYKNSKYCFFNNFFKNIFSDAL